MDPAAQMTEPRLRLHRSNSEKGRCAKCSPPLRFRSEKKSGAAAGYGVIDPKHDHGADYRHQHAPDIEAGDAGRAQQIEQIAADYGTDDAEHNVHQDTLTRADVDLARDEAGDQAQDNPS